MDIAEEKQQILNLIEKLRSGSEQSQKDGSKALAQASPVQHDRIVKRRRELLNLRAKKDKVGRDLLEERLLSICQSLERRLSSIEAVLGQQVNENENIKGGQRDSGTNLAQNLETMMPDLNIATLDGEGPAETAQAAQAAASAGRAPPSTQRPVPNLSGLIQDGMLADILQMISANTRTGVFTLEDEDDLIYLFFRDGELYHAQTGDMIGQSAFFAAMALEEGQFYFEDNEDLPEDKTIEGNTQFLILEALRQIDEDRGGE
jgi:hypothetical protein